MSGGQGVEDDLEGNRIVGKPEAVIPAITGLTAEGRSCKLLWQRLDVVPVCTASFGGRDGQDQPTWLDRKTLVRVFDGTRPIFIDITSQKCGTRTNITGDVDPFSR